MIKKEPALKSRNSIIVKLTGKRENEPEETVNIKAKRAKAKVAKKKVAKREVVAPTEKKTKTGVTPKTVAPVATSGRVVKPTATKKQVTKKTTSGKITKATKVKKEVAPKKQATPKTKTTKKGKVQTPTITTQVLEGFSFAPAVISTNQINIDYFIAKLRNIADTQDDINYRLQILTEELETIQTNLKNKGEN